MLTIQLQEQRQRLFSGETRKTQATLLILASLILSVLSYSPSLPHNVASHNSRRLLPSSLLTLSWTSKSSNNNHMIHHLTHSTRYGKNSATELMMAVTGNDDSGDESTPGLPFALPSLSQALSIWIVGISASRVYQTLTFMANSSNNNLGDDSNKIVANIALNGVLFCGACFYLLKSIQGIDYSTLEGLQTKSLANQAGKWALDGIIPTNLVVDDGNSYEVATFAGGCFWGTELHYQRIPGVIATCVGYTQGSITKPTYEQVCSGTTGHTEGIQLIYDPEICSYERLLTKLFNTINPTLLNRVGNDSGTQYRHGIYYHTETQKDIASKLFESMQIKYNGGLVTELKPAKIFWPAESYHQRYLEKGGQSADKDCEEKVRCYG